MGEGAGIMRVSGPPANSRPLPQERWIPFAFSAPLAPLRRGGHGIGLSLNQRVVSLHGGRISAGSAEGGGAEFGVELPLAEERSRV